MPEHDFSGTKQVVLSEAEEHLWMVNDSEGNQEKYVLKQFVFTMFCNIINMKSTFT